MPILPDTPDNPERRAVNLRPSDSGNDALSVTGEPIAITGTDGAVPFKSVVISVSETDSCRHLLCRDADGILRIYTTDGTIIETDPQITDLIPLGDNRFIGVTDSGNRPVLFDRTTGSYRTLPAAEDLPPISFYPCDLGRLTSSFGPRTLSSDYTSAMQLLNTDARLLTSDAADAYMRITALADAEGACIHPVLVRYRLTDIAGHDVYVSPPVLISAGGKGLQGLESGTMTLSTDNKGRTVLSGCTMGMEAFRIGAFIPALLSRIWKGFAHSFVIEASPQICPFDTERESPYIMNPRTSQPRTLTINFPGADCASTIFTRAIPAFMDNFTKCCHTIATGRLEDAGDDGGAFTDGIMFSDTTAPKRRYAKLCDILSMHDEKGILLSRLQLPHSMSVSDKVISGNAILSYGLTTMRFAGYRASHYAAGRPEALSGPLRMAVAVHFSDGSTGAVSYIDTDRGSQTLNPLITYPRADAVKISLIFLHNGQAMKADIPLQSSPDGKYAYYLHENGVAFHLTDIAQPTDEFFIPPASIATDVLTNYCVLASAENPLKATDATIIGNHRIIAAIDCANGTSLVETPRFAVFTTGGMHRISTGTSPQTPVIKSIRNTDRRVLNGCAALATDGNTVYAVSDGDLVSFNGTTVRTLHRSVTAVSETVALGFSHRGELWISTPDKLLIYLPDRGTFYRRTSSDNRNVIPHYRRMINADGELFGCCSQTGILQILSREQACTSVLLLTDLLRDDKKICRPGKPSHLHIDATGEKMELDITVMHPFAPKREPENSAIASIRVRGTLLAPVRYPLICSPIPQLRIRIEGRAASGTQFNSIKICD